MAWHSAYDRDSPLRERLEVVQRRIAQALDAMKPGPIRAISACAGQGRDLLPVLARHPRRDDVRARLIELDPRNVEAAARFATFAGLEGVEIVEADAGVSAAYAGATPADLVIVCGIFGNIPDEDVAKTIEHLPRLCGPGAAVVWTRDRRAPDLTPAIRRWFAGRGFTELSFEGEPGSFGVGVQRLAIAPEPLDPAVRLFSFVGRDAPALTPRSR